MTVVTLQSNGEPSTQHAARGAGLNSGTSIEFVDATMGISIAGRTRATGRALLQDHVGQASTSMAKMTDHDSSINKLAPERARLSKRVQRRR